MAGAADGDAVARCRRGTGGTCAARTGRRPAPPSSGRRRRRPGPARHSSHGPMRRLYSASGRPGRSSPSVEQRRRRLDPGRGDDVAVAGRRGREVGGVDRRVDPPAARRTGAACHQPRSTHSCRCGRSVPIVVSTPWPGITIVSAGRVNSLLSIDSMIVAKSPPANFVAPGPAGEQRVAAEQHRRALDLEADRARRVPGVVDRVQAQAADLDHLGVVDEHVVADVLEHRRRRRCDRRPRSRPRGSAGTAWMWSQWPWVSSTRRTPRRWHSSSSFSCSLAASISTASPVSRQRRTNTLLSYGPTTTLWISSRLSAQ